MLSPPPPSDPLRYTVKGALPKGASAPVYELRAVLSHQGNFGSGHYISFIQPVVRTYSFIYFLVVDVYICISIHIESEMETEPPRRFRIGPLHLLHLARGTNICICIQLLRYIYVCSVSNLCI